MKKNKSRKSQSTAAGRRIIASLTDLRDTLAAGIPLEQKYTVRTVSSVREPTQFDAQRVRVLRQKLGASQDVFARLVGVSRIQAQSWEQGRRVPSPLARRLLETVEADPKRFLRMLKAA